MEEKTIDIIFGVILTAVMLIITIVAIAFVVKEIEYQEEHPCIETRTIEKCNTYDRCAYGIMLPGFCITEEVTSCHEETFCVKRK